MKGHMEKDGFHPHTKYKGVRKSRDQKAKTQGIRLARKARENLTNKDKQILRDWVKQNPNWTSIDDLPNKIFIPLVSSAGDDIDKRVEIQVEAIDFMKSVTPKSKKQMHERKAREILTIQEQRDKFGFEFREKGGDELTEEINRKWENVIVKGTMHKFSKGFAITALDDLIRNFRAFFDDTNWELIAKEKGGVGIINEIRSIKKSSLIFAEERLKDRFGFGEPDPRPTEEAGKIVQQLTEPFEKMRDEQFGQIKEREADFLMAKKIIDDATDEIQDESQKQLIRGLKL